MDDIEKLVQDLISYNEAYRRGSPIVSDQEYDRLVEKLKQLEPNHPFLHIVEPERFEGKQEVRHPMPMLSTEKAYTQDELKRFVVRVQKAAGASGIGDVVYRVTAKLDGLAGRDDGVIFASRGNGEVGYEISSAFEKGVVPIGGRGLGIGEIVVVKSYFEEHLSSVFEHPRNMVVGIVSSDTLNEHARKALQDRAVHFVPYIELQRWEGSAEALIKDTADIVTRLTEGTDYPMDGVIVEVVDPDLRNAMGATVHHYRWQIAVKSKGETATTIVEQVTWQVGRTGNVTPVMEVRPISLSGATIRRVTAHHAGMVRDEKIGHGAEIEIIRSGEVIPKLEKVIRVSSQVHIPTQCPVCQTELVWQNDFLKCLNPSCRAQIEQQISHWFKTLGNADWFGIKTIQKLVQNGYDSLLKIYAMQEADFIRLGFGPVQSSNLAEALSISRNKPVEDWRFLAAFGIPNLGKGDSRKLLSVMTLEEIIKADVDDIERIDGFGAITSQAIRQGIIDLEDTIEHMLTLGFAIEKTQVIMESGMTGSAISGKRIVFTGRMQHGSREDMQAEARQLGAKVQTGVSGNTDYLVCGEKVGATKINKAKAMKIEILSENEYLQLIK